MLIHMNQMGYWVYILYIPLKTKINSNKQAGNKRRSICFTGASPFPGGIFLVTWLYSSVDASGFPGGFSVAVSGCPGGLLIVVVF